MGRFVELLEEACKSRKTKERYSFTINKEVIDKVKKLADAHQISNSGMVECMLKLNLEKVKEGKGEWK